MSGKERFCRLLNEAIADEDKAKAQEYPALGDALYKANFSDTANVERDFVAIVVILKQEGSHHELLKEMKQRRCSNV